MSRIVQTDVRPAGTPVENLARGTGEPIPARLLTASRIEMVPREDGSGREWRNEVGDLILKDPNSDRLYIQRGVLLNWHVTRGTPLAILDVNLPGLDVDPTSGEVITYDDLLARLKAFRLAGAMAETATAATPGAVMEPAEE